MWSRCPRCAATGRVQWQDEQGRTRQECLICELEDLNHYVSIYGELPPGVTPEPIHAVDLLTQRRA